MIMGEFQLLHIRELWKLFQFITRDVHLLQILESWKLLKL